MNLTGKILTFLILFLSVAFLVLAVMVGATHQEWKKVASENKNKLTEARNILKTFQGKSEEIKKKLNAERVSRRLQLAQLESQLNSARTAAEAKEAELRDQIVVSQRAQDALNNAEKRLREQDSEVSDLRNKNKNLIDDIASQRQSVVNLTNQVYQLRGEVEQMEIANSDLADELSLRVKVMDLKGLSTTEPTDHIAPEVEGVVLRIKDNLVAISVGSDDGIRAGHEFDIYRGDRYIGKARVTRAKNNMSAAKLISEFTQAPVAEGDYITTKYKY
ncbi:MAG: hypothetical protein AAGA30_10230 [Planctomycetota bacterium]